MKILILIIFLFGCSTQIEKGEKELELRVSPRIEFNLSQMPTTTIPFNLPETSHVKLVIINYYDTTIKTLIDDDFPAGFHRAVWDAKDKSDKNVPSGLYIYKIITKNFVAAGHLILLR